MRVLFFIISLILILYYLAYKHMYLYVSMYLWFEYKHMYEYMSHL